MLGLFYICIKPSVMKDSYLPDFHLGYLKIKVIWTENYLLYIINEEMSDGDHIIKEIRNIYTKENMLIRNFIVNVKITLFKTYCSTLYCCPLWIKFVKLQLVKYMLPLINGGCGLMAVVVEWLACLPVTQKIGVRFYLERESSATSG